MFSNTVHAARGLRYTYTGGKRTMLVSGGKRVLNGTGEPDGGDIFARLDPNPDNGDNQVWSIRRKTVSGDFSFDQVSYHSGNIPDLSSWAFDEASSHRPRPSRSPSSNKFRDVSPRSGFNARPVRIRAIRRHVAVCGTR